MQETRYSAKEIALQILNEAADRGTSLGKTQLVKLLYLAEVQYYKATQQRLTALEWIFYHYGPYAFELESVLSGPEFEKTQIKTEDEKDFIRYTVAERALAYKTSLEPKITLLIKKIVGEWKEKPLPELLDYVYFETEPMQVVKRRGDPLDFTTVKPADELTKVIPMKASKEAEKKVAELRARMQGFLESVAEARPNEASVLPEYIEAIKAWEEEERPDIIVPPNLVVQITTSSKDSADQGT